jgi:aminopeptidase N
MEMASKTDLAPLKETWLVNTEFPWEVVKTYLMSKSASLALFFELENTTTENTVFDEEKLMWVWGDEMPKPFKREFLFNYGTQLTDSSLVTLVKNESVVVRQAVALSLPTISEALRTSFESMLRDKSYVTQETVLFKLWQAFPKNRVGYLEALDGVVGLPNKNVRQLWLTLALITSEFQPENKKAFYAELNGYTAPHYNFEVRQLAFQYLYQIRAVNDTSLQNLFDASDHHVWQFKKSSRNLLREMYSSPEGKERLETIKTKLSDELKKVWDIVLQPE